MVFAVVFLIVRALPLAFGSAPRLRSLAIAGVFLGAAFFAPALLGPLNRLWLRLGLLLHRIASPVVMAMMFFLVVTPIGLVMRLLRKDTLRLPFDAAPGRTGSTGFRPVGRPRACPTSSRKNSMSLVLEL